MMCLIQIRLNSLISLVLYEVLMVSKKHLNIKLIFNFIQINKNKRIKIEIKGKIHSYS